MISCKRPATRSHAFCAQPTSVGRPGGFRSGVAAVYKVFQQCRPLPRASQFPSLAPLNDNYEATHAFSSYANWLVPEHIMLGRYPYVEPARCFTKEQGDKQLEQLLKAGITTFVCLQGELPAQEELEQLESKNGFLAYKPWAERIQAEMMEAPVTGEVSGSTAAARHAPQAQQHRQLHFVYCPVKDLGLPAPGILEVLLWDLKQRLDMGERLYIHCWSGRGRTGVVAACLLACYFGIDADEAMERVQLGYDTRSGIQSRSVGFERHPMTRSPETDEQREFVRRYAKEWARQQSLRPSGVVYAPVPVHARQG